MLPKSNEIVYIDQKYHLIIPNKAIGLLMTEHLETTRGLNKNQNTSDTANTPPRNNKPLQLAPSVQTTSAETGTLITQSNHIAHRVSWTTE